MQGQPGRLGSHRREVPAVLGGILLPFPLSLKLPCSARQLDREFSVPCILSAGPVPGKVDCDSSSLSFSWTP